MSGSGRAILSAFEQAAAFRKARCCASPRAQHPRLHHVRHRIHGPTALICLMSVTTPFPRIHLLAPLTCLSAILYYLVDESKGRV